METLSVSRFCAQHAETKWMNPGFLQEAGLLDLDPGHRQGEGKVEKMDSTLVTSAA